MPSTSFQKAKSGRCHLVIYAGNARHQTARRSQTFCHINSGIGTIILQYIRLSKARSAEKFLSFRRSVSSRNSDTFEAVSQITLKEVLRNWMGRLIWVAIQDCQYHTESKSWLIYFCEMSLGNKRAPSAGNAPSLALRVVR
jgi:hypothetical protein